jgi:hypothetical protein
LFAAALVVIAAGGSGGVRAADAAAERNFDERVAPIFIRHCLECHSGVEPKGNLDLSRRAAAQKGGDSGEPIVAGKPEASLLWQRVRDDEMPPKHPLGEADKTALRNWIAAGATWNGDELDLFRFTTERRAGYDWWALQPLASPALLVNDFDPAFDPAWARNGIDRFIAAKLAERGLHPSARADRRTLIRRLSFDLLGLPPSPEQVEAFVSDTREDAYERLVDELLASPHYGVRWARHWLDVARFGESQGFERDKLRENAWPYRDWVVDAFNTDFPYDEFARLQIAGDVLRPDEPAAVIATGFLVAGPYDEVGKQQQSAAMKAVVRQDELEDFASVVGQTFLGLTVHCARCHDHKFDPIRQREYYQMTAALDGVQHGSRDVISRADRLRAERLDRELTALKDARRALLASARRRASADGDQAAKLRTAAPAPLGRWTFDEDAKDSAGPLHASLQGAARLHEGRLVVDGKDSYAATVPLTADLRVKTLEAWVRLDDLEQRGGGAISVQTLDGQVFDAIVFGEQEPGRWMAGSDHFQRTKSFGGPEETGAAERIVHVAIVYHADGTIAGYRDGKPYGNPYKSDGPVKFAAGKAQLVFGLRHGAPSGNHLLRGAIEAAQLYDRALTAEEIAASAAAEAGGFSVARLLALMTDDQRQAHARLEAQIERLSAERDGVKPLSVYAVTPAAPGVSHVLLRGNPAAKGDVVAASGVAALIGPAADFGLPPDAPDKPRREELANWITDVHNPLFARVIVNRLWHYHFGVGLVDTPNDFGFNGGRPTHPELIDYLAGELLRSRWSLKSVQRLIVTSATYQQASQSRGDALAIDAGNRLLWRMSPQRLEAEAIRDATLAVTGQLNTEFGGLGYRDFTTFVRNTQFYEMLDPVGPEFNRRSIYRTWVRSGRSSFLDTFDCPDPSTKTPDRAVTVTPLQALALMNNSFVLRMSERFAERLRREAGDDARRQIARACRLAYARDPTGEELQIVLPFVEQHGLAEFCRVLLNSNEFLYID